MKSNLHSLIHFLLFLLNYSARCQLRRLSQFYAATASSGTRLGRSSHIASERTYRERRLQHLFYCYVTSSRTHMQRVLHSNSRCLQSHSLAMGLYATAFHSFAYFVEMYNKYELFLAICIIFKVFLYISISVSGAEYVLCIGGCVFFLIYFTYMFIASGLERLSRLTYIL
jgi:hypothetical protein